MNPEDFADRSYSPSSPSAMKSIVAKIPNPSGVSKLACSLFLQSYRSSERQTSSLFCRLCRGEKCHLCTKRHLCVKMVLQKCRERAGVDDDLHHHVYYYSSGSLKGQTATCFEDGEFPRHLVQHDSTIFPACLDVVFSLVDRCKDVPPYSSMLQTMLLSTRDCLINPLAPSCGSLRGTPH